MPTIWRRRPNGSKRLLKHTARYLMLQNVPGTCHLNVCVCKCTCRFAVCVLRFNCDASHNNADPPLPFSALPIRYDNHRDSILRGGAGKSLAINMQAFSTMQMYVCACVNEKYFMHKRQNLTMRIHPPNCPHLQQPDCLQTLPYPFAHTRTCDLDLVLLLICLFLKAGVDEEDNYIGIDLFKFFSRSCYKGYTDEEGGFYAIYNAVFEVIDELEYEEVEGLQVPLSLSLSIVPSQSVCLCVCVSMYMCMCMCHR